MSLRLAAHWTVVLLAAACAVAVTTIPFTGTAASAVSALAAAGVCLIGIATAPHIKRRP